MECRDFPSEYSEAESESSINQRIHGNDIYPDTSYESRNIGLSAFVEPQSSFSSTRDPVSDDPRRPAEMTHFETGGFADVSGEDRRIVRPQLAYELGGTYRYDDDIAVEAKQSNQQRILRERRRDRRHDENRRARGARAVPSTLDEQGGSNMSQGMFRNFLEGVSSGDEPEDEQDDEEKEQKKQKIQERRYLAQLNNEQMDPLDLDDLDYEEEQLWEKEEIDQEMRIARRREELRAYLAYARNLKKQRTLMTIVEPTGEMTAKPNRKAQQSAADFSTKREADLLEKISRPPAISPSYLANLDAKYEKNKKIMEEEERLSVALQDFKTAQEKAIAKVSLQMRAHVEDSINVTLQQEQELIDGIENYEDKQQMKEDYKRKCSLFNDLKKCTAKIKHLCDSNIDILPVSNNVEANEANNVESSSVIAEEWPYCLLVEEKTTTSREICTFLTRIRRDAYAASEPKGIELIAKLTFFRGYSTFDENDFSSLVNFDEIEPDLRARGVECLRPVLIDGCGVAFAYDKDYAPLCNGPTKKIPFQRNRVLPVYPLVLLALRLTLMGFKLRIILPEYYRIAFFKDQRRLKVDNLYAFEKLVELQLIAFWDPQEEEDNIMDMIKQKANEMGAAIISDSAVEEGHAYRRRQRVDETNDDFSVDLAEQLMDEDEANAYQKTMKIEKMKGNCSDRVLSVCFHTVRKDMFITREYHDIVAVGEVNHTNRRFKYFPIGEEVTLFYTDTPGDVLDAEIRHSNQLLFGVQAKLVLGLCQLYDLTKIDLWACMLLLGYAQIHSIIPDEIAIFMEKYDPFIVPDSQVISLARQDLSLQEATNKKMRTQLQEQKSAWKQKLNLLEREKARWKSLVTRFEFTYDFSTEDEDNENGGSQ